MFRKTIFFILFLVVGFAAGYFSKSSQSILPEKAVQVVQGNQQNEINAVIPTHPKQILVSDRSYECDDDFTMQVTDYIPVDTPSAVVHLSDRPDITLWGTNGSHSYFFTSDDGMYSFYDVPANSYLLEKGNPIRVGCYVKNIENHYGI